MTSMPDESPRFSPFEELGNRALTRNSGLRRDEYLPGLRSGQKAAQVWSEMIADPIVGAVLFQIEMVLRRVEWNVEAETTDKVDLDRAELIESCMHDMSLPWEDMIADALTMLPHGFAYLELVYKRRQGPQQKDPSKRSDSNDGKIGWRKMALIPQDTVADWQMDDQGGVQGCQQQAGWGQSVTIPIDKALLFRTKKRTPWGSSVLRSAYTPWYFKKRIEEIEAIGVERDLAGLPVMYVAAEILANASLRSEYQDIVRNIRRDEQEGVLLPQQWDENGNRAVELTLLNSGGARQFNTGEMIDRKSREIAMSLLQDVLLLGHLRVGTQALASEKRDLSDVALSTWLNEIAAVLNAHAVPRLLALNGLPLEAAPKIVPGDLRQEDAETWSVALKNVAQAGVPIVGPDELEVVNFARRRLGMPLVDPAEYEAMPEPQLPVLPAPPQDRPGPAPDEGTMPDGTEMTDG